MINRHYFQIQSRPVSLGPWSGPDVTSQYLLAKACFARIKMLTERYPESTTEYRVVEVTIQVKVVLGLGEVAAVAGRREGEIGGG